MAWPSWGGGPESFIFYSTIGGYFIFGNESKRDIQVLRLKMKLCILQCAPVNHLETMGEQGDGRYLFPSIANSNVIYIYINKKNSCSPGRRAE